MRLKNLLIGSLSFNHGRLHGNFPQILEDKKIGSAAKDLWRDAKNMFVKLKDSNIVKPSAVIGFWPANSIEDDILIFEDDSRKKVIKTFIF